MELKKYFDTMKKRWWLIVLFVLVSCTTTFVFSTYYVQPVYEASTKLLVNQTEDTGELPLDVNTLNMNILLINTYKEIVRSPAVMDEVVAQYPALNLTTEDLIERVRVDSESQTQVMTLSVQDPSYDVAAQIVNAVSVVFQSKIETIMNLKNVEILFDARPKSDPAPVNMSPMISLILSFILSLCAGIGMTFLLEYLDESVHSEEDLEAQFQIPTLGMIRKLKRKDFIYGNGEATVKNKGGEPTYVTAKS
ncbi:YveK family protein [Marinicrinis sediminis]|uniref:YveK family protein n=1 Tax=Marinicrinis sediminis TaxID=1652465 RepID=A0ABW5RCB1_9BACL